jgi:transcriptional regulator with XRE-family HTH domain
MTRKTAVASIAVLHRGILMDDADRIARRIGERIREARRRKGMILAALSAPTGLSAAFLSRLERGETSTSIGNLIRMAGVLGIELQDFFAADEAPAKTADYRLVRRPERLAGPMLAAAGYTYERLAGDLAGRHLDAFELEFPAGARKPILLVAHPGEEILFLLTGRIEFQVAADRFVMNAGDCLHFNSAQPHMGRNIGKQPARLLMVVSPSRAPATQARRWMTPGLADIEHKRMVRAVAHQRHRASKGEKR